MPFGSGPHLVRPFPCSSLGYTIGRIRVAGKIVRKCPLTDRWLVTSDEYRRLLRQAVRDYLAEKKGL
jgi:hypothetical protein